MKFLVLALCVCAANAASVDYNAFNSYKPEQYKFARPAVPNYSAKFVAPTPIAKAFEPANIVASPAVVENPVVDPKTVEDVKPANIPVFKPLEPAPIFPGAPIVTPKSAFDNGRYFGVDPVPSIVPKSVYSSSGYINNVAPIPNNYYKNNNEAEAPIVRSESDVSAEGFSFTYETANGIAAQANGGLKEVDGSPVLVIRGSYQYTAPDGTPVKVEYEADENGFRPRSDLIPDTIARSLDFIAANPPRRESYVVA